MRKGWIVGLAAVMASASPAAAQWATMPNGELGYTFSYSTVGFFGCSTVYVDIGTCTSTGSSVVLARDGTTMTMSYTGAAATVTATNVAQTVSLGGVTTTVSGPGPFLPPHLFSPNAVLVGLYVQMFATDPLGLAGFCRPMGTRPEGFVSYGTEYGCSRNIFLATPPPPAPATYDGIVFSDIPHLAISYEPGQYDLTATVSVIPEPATLALTATGLLALAGVAMRRRRP